MPGGNPKSCMPPVRDQINAWLFIGSTATDGCRRETMRLGQNNCGLAGRCRAQCRENPLLVLPNIFRAARSTQVLSGIKDRRGSRKRLRVILQIGSRNEELV